MSVTAVVKNGRSCWQVQVIRGKTRIRRFLDRKKHLRQDALERELLAALDAEKGGNPRPTPPITQPNAVPAALDTPVTPSPTPTWVFPAPIGWPPPSQETSPGSAPALASGSAPMLTSMSTPAATSAPRQARPSRTRRPRPADPPPPSAVVLTPSPTTPQPVLFAAFAERYLALADSAKSDHVNKARNVRNHLIPALGDLPLRAINRVVIDDLRVRLREPGDEACSYRSRHRKEKPVSARRRSRPRTAKTVNNILATLRGILNLAFDYELVDRVPRIRPDREARREPDFLGFDETEAFLAAASLEWAVMFLVAVRTGVRRGELLELRWRDVHLDGPRPQLRVSRSVKIEPHGVHTIKEPKGRRGRSIPLAPSVLQALRRLKAERERELLGNLGNPRSGGPLEGALVFPGEDGGHRNYRRYYAAVIATAKQAGIARHVHPHLLRHTFASHCYMRRVPPQIVQKWLGHSSVTTTERYAHLRPDADDELIQVVDQGSCAEPADSGATRGATKSGVSA